MTSDEFSNHPELELDSILKSVLEDPLYATSELPLDSALGTEGHVTMANSSQISAPASVEKPENSPIVNESSGSLPPPGQVSREVNDTFFKQSSTIEEVSNQAFPKIAAYAKEQERTDIQINSIKKDLMAFEINNSKSKASSGNGHQGDQVQVHYQSQINHQAPQGPSQPMMPLKELSLNPPTFQQGQPGLVIHQKTQYIIEPVPYHGHNGQAPAASIPQPGATFKRPSMEAPWTDIHKPMPMVNYPMNCPPAYHHQGGPGPMRPNVRQVQSKPPSYRPSPYQTPKGTTSQSLRVSPTQSPRGFKVDPGMTNSWTPGSSAAPFVNNVHGSHPNLGSSLTASVGPIMVNHHPHCNPVATAAANPRNSNPTTVPVARPCHKNGPGNNAKVKREAKDRPWRCPERSKKDPSKQCESSFHRQDELKRHMKIHSEIKPFQCEFCPMAFTRTDHLTTHRRTHTKEKPYVCKYEGCNKAFARSDERLRHHNVHENRRVKQEQKELEQRNKKAGHNQPNLHRQNPNPQQQSAGHMHPAHPHGSMVLQGPSREYFIPQADLISNIPPSHPRNAAHVHNGNYCTVPPTPARTSHAPSGMQTPARSGYVTPSTVPPMNVQPKREGSEEMEPTHINYMDASGPMM